MCINCNVQTCPGGCAAGGFTIVGGANGFSVAQGQYSNTLNPYQNTLGFIQQGQPTQAQNLHDYALHDFLNVIADKTDADACVTFIEKLFKTKARQLEFIEQLKRQNQDALDKEESDFLILCQKYRPSITPEMIERIKKLKAFY